MVSNQSLRRMLFSALLIFTLFAVAVVPATAQDSDPHSSAASSRKPVFDRYFIDFMVPAHEAAISLYEYALTKPIHEELRAVLVKEIAMAREENEMMLDWREDWYGSRNVPDPASVPTFPESAKWERGIERVDLTLPLQHLQMVPDEQFEQAFLDKAMHMNLDAAAVALIERHHDGHREVYDLSRHMVVAHTEVAELFGKMRDEWYYGIDWPEVGDGGGTPTATPVPTGTVTDVPTVVPTGTVTEVPTGVPTDLPTDEPTFVPTVPTDLPTVPPIETPGP